MNASSARPPVWSVVQAHLRAQPRKSAVLAALAIVLVVVSVRTLMRSGMPSTAEAQVVEDPAQSDEGAALSAPQPAAGRVSLPRPLVRELPLDPFVLNVSQLPGAEPEGSEAVEIITPDAGEEIRELASSLVLQSTMYGEKPVACINGQLLRPGQQIEGFVVERVSATRVVLKKDGVEVALSLK